MFIKTLGFKTRSRIEYFFRKLKKTDSLNSLKAPIDGRKNNRVRSRTHSKEFLNELHTFIDSFKPVKHSRRSVIHNYKPIDLYRILCKRLDYELIYEDKNIKIKKKVELNSSVRPDRASGHQSNIKIVNEFYDESMNLTNGPILYINEISNDLSSHSAISSQPLIRQTRNENYADLNFTQLNLNSNQGASSNQMNHRSDDRKKDEICSFSYFVRFLKMNNFECK